MRKKKTFQKGEISSGVSAKAKAIRVSAMVFVVLQLSCANLFAKPVTAGQAEDEKSGR